MIDCISSLKPLSVDFLEKKSHYSCCGLAFFLIHSFNMSPVRQWFMCGMGDVLPGTESVSWMILILISFSDSQKLGPTTLKLRDTPLLKGYRYSSLKQQNVYNFWHLALGILGHGILMLLRMPGFKSYSLIPLVTRLWRIWRLMLMFLKVVKFLISHLHKV